MQHSALNRIDADTGRLVKTSVLGALTALAIVVIVGAQAAPAAAYAIPYDKKYYDIRPVASGLCLDVGGWSRDNGAPVVQWGCHGGANQQWQPRFVGYCGKQQGSLQERPCYAFKNLHSGKCLDVPGGDPVPGNKMMQWECNYSRAQVFTVLTQPGGYDDLKFTLLSATSDLWQSRFRCLDVPSARRDWGLRLQIWNCNGNVAQAFYMYGFRR